MLNVLQILSQAFSRYREARGVGTSDLGKSVQRELQEAGVCGAPALALLEQHREMLAWESMDPATFGAFYRFVFLACRDPGRRFMPTERAVRAWRLLLAGRFRLLVQWCAFVERQARPSVPEDTWRQVLDFSRSVHEDLGDYDPTGAWPVVVDEFVEHLRAQRGGSGNNSGSASGQLSRSFNSQQMLPGAPAMLLPPLSPKAGSKRRHCSADMDAVTTQLQGMHAPSCGADTVPQRQAKVARRKQRGFN